MVIVENQLQRAHTMRQIQYAIEAWVYGRYGHSVKVIHQSGSAKLHIGTDIDRQELALAKTGCTPYKSYKLNKEYAVMMAERMLGSHVSEFLVNGAKHDDLSDALCHAVYFCTTKLKR